MFHDKQEATRSMSRQRLACDFVAGMSVTEDTHCMEPKSSSSLMLPERSKRAHSRNRFLKTVRFKLHAPMFALWSMMNGDFNAEDYLHKALSTFENAVFLLPYYKLRDPRWHHEGTALGEKKGNENHTHS